MKDFQHKLRSRLHSLLLVCALVSTLPLTATAAVVEEDPNLGPQAGGDRQGVFLEYLNYEDYIYSQSKKTELGDAVKVDIGVRYQHSKDTFMRVRFFTDPAENRFNNKTSNFEFLAGHQRENWYFQIDTDIATSDGPTGGTSIGLDLDSELTEIAYSADNFEFIFYPFNFDTEVGSEFNTRDVARIFFIEGAPTSVSQVQAGGEKIASKTLPGFELAYRFGENQAGRAYVGFGAATYLYPLNPAFDITTSPVADRWERKEDVGYKLGMTYAVPDQMRLKFQLAGHNETVETGSLLAGAASAYGIFRFGDVLFENEYTASQAGKAPYRLLRSGEWFEDKVPYQPVYSDVFGARQNWIDKSDMAASFRLGFQRENFVPYLTYKYQGGNFIFRDRESAHLLRTGDESESHGGLQRAGFGAFFYSGNFVVNPEFEYYKAKNAVFANSADIRADRRLATFRSEDYQARILITYRVDGTQTFKP